MSDTDRENMLRALMRVVWVRVPAAHILRFMFAQQSQPECVALPDSNLPDGFNVIAVRSSEEPKSFEVLVQHDSFAEVPEGEVPPHFPDYIVMWRLHELKRG